MTAHLIWLATGAVAAIALAGCLPHRGHHRQPAQARYRLEALRNRARLRAALIAYDVATWRRLRRIMKLRKRAAAASALPDQAGTAPAPPIPGAVPLIAEPSACDGHPSVLIRLADTAAEGWPELSPARRYAPENEYDGPFIAGAPTGPQVMAP